MYLVVLFVSRILRRLRHLRRGHVTVGHTAVNLRAQLRHLFVPRLALPTIRDIPRLRSLALPPVLLTTLPVRYLLKHILIQSYSTDKMKVHILHLRPVLRLSSHACHRRNLHMLVKDAACPCCCSALQIFAVRSHERIAPLRVLHLAENQVKRPAVDFRRCLATRTIPHRGRHIESRPALLCARCWLCADGAAA